LKKVYGYIELYYPVGQNIKLTMLLATFWEGIEFFDAADGLRRETLCEI
jgi:hypothetical protein